MATVIDSNAIHVVAFVQQAYPILAAAAVFNVTALSSRRQVVVV